ncbi:MAG: hypothetical protein ACTTK0_03105 [Stomatobaculum sp.]
MFDLVLKNGILVDPANGLNGEKADIAIYDRRIVEIGTVKGESVYELELNDMTVTPGLIDFHAHFR